jgi:hypothetical protein
MTGPLLIRLLWLGHVLYQVGMNNYNMSFLIARVCLVLIMGNQPNLILDLTPNSAAILELRSKIVRQQLLVSVYFHFLLRDARPSLLEVPLAVLLSDTEEIFPLLLIFPSNTYLLAYFLASQ